MKVFLFDDFNSLDESFIENNLMLMPDERQQRYHKFRQVKDKKLCVIAYALLCFGLKQLYGIEGRLEFQYNQYGKPYIKEYPNIFFSISHTDGLALCAISDAEIGADCEKIGNYDDGVAKMISSTNEYEYLNKTNDKNRMFFKLWTLKESYIKAIGMGLSMPLNSFEFELDTSTNNYTLKEYNLKNITYKDFYSISFCERETYNECLTVIYNCEIGSSCEMQIKPH